MKKIFFHLNVLFALLCSCSSNNVGEEATLRVPIAESTELLRLQDLVKSTDVIQIETNDTLYVSDIDDVLMSNDRIYILDKKQAAVIMYDNNGRFLKRYRKLGRASNEYKSIDDWACDDNQIYLLDFNKILILDCNLKYLKTINLTECIDVENFIGADRIALYNNKLFVYDDNSKSVYSITKDGQSFIQHILTDKRKCNLMVGINPNEKVFHLLDDALYIIPGRSDCIYKLKGDDIELFAVIDYAGKQKRYDVLNSRMVEDYNVRHSNTPYSIHKMFTSNDNIYMFYPDRGGSYVEIAMKDSTIHEYVGYKRGMKIEKDHPFWDAINTNRWYRLVEKSFEELRDTSSYIVGDIPMTNIHGCKGEILQYLVIYNL